MVAGPAARTSSRWRPGLTAGDGSGGPPSTAIASAVPSSASAWSVPSAFTRERLAQVERQRADDEPRAHLRLPVQVDGIDAIVADLELGELRRRAPGAPAR